MDIETFELTKQQLAAAEGIEIHKILILTGKPGTGKTSAVKNILDKAKGRGLTIVQCAPTGKAAKRMTEATGFPASTVHAALACEFDGEGFRFKHNEHNPIPTDLLVIDEFSMMDTNLAASLLRAVDIARTHVLIVGDTGQLPSIGPGAVLHDMLASGVIPHVELGKIQRNTGEIVAACAKVHDGEAYNPASKLDMEAEDPINLIHRESSNPSRTISGILRIITERMPLRGYDPVWDIQVISPTNIKTDLSCESLNEALQEILNPGPIEKGLIFKVGDKVINTKNETLPEANTNREQYIVNGDMGRVAEINSKKIIVEFFSPPRVVAMSRATNNLLLAYAVTCHKMQGSESPVIIVPVDRAFGFCDRRWLYTALSRGKDIVITIGQFSAVERMIDNVSRLRRNTRLKEKLIEAIVPKEVCH